MAWNPEDVSVRESILRAFVAALSAEGSPAVRVTRSKLDQITADDLPCFDVSPGPEGYGKDYGDNDSWSRALSVKVRAVIDATENDDGALDPFYLFAARRIVNDAGIKEFAPQVEWTGADGVFRPEGRDILGLEMQFDVTFAVQSGDPAKKG